MAEKMPRLVSMLGFSEEDWEAWCEFRSQMGDMPTVIQGFKAANEQIQVGLVEIHIISQMLKKLHPREYTEAAQELGIVME